MKMWVNFQKLHEDAIPFTYKHSDDACADMYALEDKFIRPGQTCLVKTGIAVEIPIGYEGRVRGRSGLASKGILCHSGTIDAGYRGDVGIILTNTSVDSFCAKKGDRLAQFSINPITLIKLIEKTELSNSDRGDKGFGSSGI